jgi:hypothetical protein
MADNIQVELNEQLVEQQSRAFGRLMATDKETRKRIQKIIREELKDAAKRLREDAKYELKEDPRKAFRAVKTSIYRKILGGNVSILNPRRAGARYQLVRPRKLDQNPRQRGGNRRKRSERTNAIDSYFGKDRAFILRFVNNGTNDRQTRYGNRGRISVSGNWFPNMGQKELELAAENLANIMEEELAEAFEEMNKNK